MTLSYGTKDNGYSGLDQWNRVVDQVWQSGGIVDRYQYGYDAAGNRLYKKNAGPGASGLDELYSYDALYRLIATQRGTLSADKSAITGTSPVPLAQNWTLDGLGNFSQFNNNGVAQNRTTNAANQITAITGSGAASPTYDATGNLTRDAALNYDPETEVSSHDTQGLGLE